MKDCIMISEATGICFTCFNEPGCTIKMNKVLPIWECSEFSNDGPDMQQEIASFTLRNGSNGSKVLKGEVKGLCQNCELIDTCKWFRQDAVIFHCEHYQ